MKTEFIFVFIAAASAGISVTCFLLLMLKMLESIEVDREIGVELRKNLPLLIRLVMPLAPNFRFLARSPFFSSTVLRTEEQLQMAGYGESVSAVDFVAARIVFSTLSVIFLILCIIKGSPLLGVILLAALIIYPAVWLKKTVQKRHLQILKALPNVLDLLTLSVEAGKDFLTSLRDILNRRKMDALGEELSRSFREIQLGKKRSQALRELSQRVQQSDLTAVLNAIIQAEELGVSIGQLLRIQGDMLRNKRFTRAEKLANEAPVKILFPVIVFIFPAVIIILMTPILMQAFKMLAP